MNKLSSLYLDLLRILSAFYVFIYHVGSETIGGNLVFSTQSISSKVGLLYLSAHYFVIVFFVLSGFLITMSANRKGTTLKSFFTARLGRLYSVLIPSLLFSLFTAFILIKTKIFPSEIIHNYSQLLPRIFLNISFMAQSWSLCASPPLNNPFWSVMYEFLYYLIIASFFLVKGNTKYIYILFVFLIAGLKVMLLFPCWLMGSLLFILFSKGIRLNYGFSLGIFILSTFIILLIITGYTTIPFTKQPSECLFLGKSIFYSWNFIADFIFSSLIALNIFSFFHFSNTLLPYINGNKFSYFERMIKLISNCTYTLYLFHLPLLFLFSSILPYNRTNPYHQLSLIILVIVLTYFIARNTEWKVNLWRGFIEKIFNIPSSFKNK